MGDEYQPRGLYFEEFEIGQRVVTRGRTITEADIVSFAGLSGDFNPMHVDAVYSEGDMFGKRVAHGLLVLSVASGLAYQTGFLDGTVLAFTGIDWKFRKPTYIGDTIHVVAQVAKKREMKAAGGGFITFKVEVVNQDGEVAQKGEWVVLVASKSASG